MTGFEMHAVKAERKIKSESSKLYEKYDLTHSFQ